MRFQITLLENTRPHFGHCAFCDIWPYT